MGKFLVKKPLPVASMNIFLTLDQKQQLKCLGLKDHLRCILRYYATFKVREFEWLFYKINTFLQKTTTCIGLEAEQIFSVNI